MLTGTLVSKHFCISFKHFALFSRISAFGPQMLTCVASVGCVGCWLDDILSIILLASAVLGLVAALLDTCHTTQVHTAARCQAITLLQAGSEAATTAIYTKV